MKHHRLTATSRREVTEDSGQVRAPQAGASGTIRVLRFQAVRDRTGLSRSTIWRVERRGLFPRHRQISPNAVGWIEGELNDWIQTRSQRAPG